ncbi:MAG: hypothetical protein ABIQ95_12900 [Bdellovibrionia bacterium]
MKFSINTVLLLGSCMVSANAFAATNGEVLKELFDNGTAPATAEDFPQRYYGTGEYLTPPTNRCVILDSFGQSYGYDISRTVRFTPAAGPLIPEKRQEKLVFGNSSSSYNLFPDPVVEGQTLVLTNPKYKSWVDGNDGVVHFIPGQLFATKSGEYVAFKIFVKAHGEARNQSYYGYCYPRSRLPLF